MFISKFGAGDVPKERILIYGGPGSGKSSTAFHIASMLKQSNTPGVVHILDTDSSARRTVLEGYSNLDNISVHNITSWEDLLITKTLEFGPHDWLVIDFISDAWQMVQDWYAEQVFGNVMADQIMYARQKIEENARNNSKSKVPQVLDAWRDWPAINANYRHWMNSFCAGDRVNVLAIARGKNMGENVDTAMLAMTKNANSVIPDGQKNLMHNFHTVLYFVSQGKKFMFTMVKDRERDLQVNVETLRFPISYLTNIAGWKIVAAEEVKGEGDPKSALELAATLPPSLAALLAK